MIFLRQMFNYPTYNHYKQGNANLQSHSTSNEQISETDLFRFHSNFGHEFIGPRQELLKMFGPLDPFLPLEDCLNNSTRKKCLTKKFLNSSTPKPVATKKYIFLGIFWGSQASEMRNSKFFFVKHFFRVELFKQQEGSKGSMGQKIFKIFFQNLSIR